MSNGIKSWSWSRYADYVQCPRKAKLKHVDRHKEPGSAPMVRGARIHDILSGFVKGTIRALPASFEYEFEGERFEEKFPNMKYALPMLAKMKVAYKKDPKKMTVEDDWAFRKDWSITRWDDWTGCWVRMKLDLAYLEDRGSTLVIVDWKSGKARVEEEVAYAQQLQLYAVAGLLKYPKVKRVKPCLSFVDAGKNYNGAIVERKDLAKLQKEWAKSTAPMFLDTIFAPRPNQKCRWCWFGQAKKGTEEAPGGPGLCEF